MKMPSIQFGIFSLLLSEHWFAVCNLLITQNNPVGFPAESCFHEIPWLEEASLKLDIFTTEVHAKKIELGY